MRCAGTDAGHNEPEKTAHCDPSYSASRLLRTHRSRRRSPDPSREAAVSMREHEEGKHHLQPEKKDRGRPFRSGRSQRWKRNDPALELCYRRRTKRSTSGHTFSTPPAQSGGKTSVRGQLFASIALQPFCLRDSSHSSNEARLKRQSPPTPTLKAGKSPLFASL